MCWGRQQAQKKQERVGPCVFVLEMAGAVCSLLGAQTSRDVSEKIQKLLPMVWLENSG